MTLPIYIPESMVKFCSKKEGPAWLERLPELVTGCAQRWQLHPGPPLNDSFVLMKVNYITPAILEDGTEVILKVFKSKRTFDEEYEGLRHTDKEGAVELLAIDVETPALLLERVCPGVPLAEQPDDEENTRIAAQVMRQYWQPEPPDHSLHSVEDEIENLNRLREQFDGSTGPIPETWVIRAEAAFAELKAASKGPMVLHGDLHHWNILSAERKPWLAIDPHGFVGDPGYDLKAILCNFPPKSCEGKDTGRLRARRATILAEELGMERELVLTWGWACAVLSATIYLDDWEFHIARAEDLKRQM